MTDQIILNADPRERTGTNKAREIRNVDGMVPAIVLASEMTRILLHFLASLDKGIEFVTTNSSIEDSFSLSMAGPERTGWVI